MNTQPVILYVEDEPLSRKVMRMLATHLDLPNVIIFEDSTDIVTRATALDPKPEVIFLDIHMKPYTGFEMLAMLRKTEQFSHTPIVAMTASVMNEEVQQLQTAGFNGCISKPIDIDTFPDTLRRIMTGEAIWRIIT